MRKLFLALLILGSGAALFVNIKNANAHLRQQIAAANEILEERTVAVEQLRSQQAELNRQVRDLKRELGRQSHPSVDADRLALIEEGGKGTLTEEAREKLFEELGFDWHASPEHLVVSKDSLRQIDLGALENNQLSDALCGVLDIQPSERTALDSVLQQIHADHAAWVVANARREAPSGDILAKYHIPANPELGSSFSNALASAASTTLGDDRAGFFVEYVGNSMYQSRLLAGNESTLMIERYLANNQPRLRCEVKSQHSSSSHDITRHQTFPAAFRPLFPGGWKELAERDGFELPDDFNQN